MGYEQDFKYKDALKSLFDAAKTVSENVFTNDRPAAVPKQMDYFIVVSLPGLLSSMTYGSGFGNIRTYCTIEVYVRQELQQWYKRDWESYDAAYRDWETDRKSTRLNSSHITRSRMPSSA